MKGGDTSQLQTRKLGHCSYEDDLTCIKSGLRHLASRNPLYIADFQEGEYGLETDTKKCGKAFMLEFMT